jgi:endonuclease/exonuclease/phosphatase (EEP) superfamily protein YafD
MKMKSQRSLLLGDWREVARRTGAVGGLLASVGTLLSFRRSTSWFFRIWDYPRLQVAGSALLAAVLYGVGTGRPTWCRDRTFLSVLAATVAVQARKIAVYTPLWPVRVERSRGAAGPADRLRLLILNVERENSSFARVLDVTRSHDPDVVLAVEVDQRWARALEPLAERYRYSVVVPQENHYGMVLYSRYPLEDARVEFLVQEDVPSIHTYVVLPSGTRVDFRGLHPRPPEPQRDQDSDARDAELLLVGQAIGSTETARPTVVAGDLNDVAWSRTTTLFLRLSGLLDPRIGRGFYNSFNARNPLLRWPLDHIFHSADFRLVELRRLEYVGSDHFPLFAELSYEPVSLRRRYARDAMREEEARAAEANSTRDADPRTLRARGG